MKDSDGQPAEETPGKSGKVPRKKAVSPCSWGVALPMGRRSPAWSAPTPMGGGFLWRLLTLVWPKTDYLQPLSPLEDRAQELRVPSFCHGLSW